MDTSTDAAVLRAGPANSVFASLSLSFSQHLLTSGLWQSTPSTSSQDRLSDGVVLEPANPSSRRQKRRKRLQVPAKPDVATVYVPTTESRQSRRLTRRRAVSMSHGSAASSSSGASQGDIFASLRKDSGIIPLGSSSLSSFRDKGSVPLSDVPLEGEAPKVLLPVEPKRVLILMSDTGGGHRASAEAIRQAFELEYGNQYQVAIVDLWKEHTPWPFNRMPNSYSFLVKHEWMWKLAFDISKPRFVHQPQMAATSAIVAREVAKMYSKYQPDAIISVHPLMQHVPLRVLRSRGLLHRIPFATVITDLNTCHPTWFHKLVTACFAPTKEVGDRAAKQGLKPSQVKVHGLPIRPDFCRPLPPRNELRKQLGMDLELPAVLLVGGGEGMGPVEATARALAEQLGAGANNEPHKGQLIIICGRNKKLAATLEAIKWPLPVQVKGFVNNMNEWMGACDCIITKAGPGTIAEGLIRGLPLILNDFIAGQETGNIPFVVDNGVGKYIEKPQEIAQQVADWFGPAKDELAEMAKNALKLARPQAVFNIVRDLDELVRKRQPLHQASMAYV